MYGRPFSGWIEVICGSMFSGKTEELLRRVRRAQIARQRVQLFKHSLDRRYDAVKVTSHNGLSETAIPVHSTAELEANLDEEADVIAIDEVQFFDEAIVELCEALARRGKRVICAGLDLDFRGLPFGPMPALLAVAEEVSKLHAICVVCGGPASRSQRLINGRPARFDDPIIVVGASETYEARCRGCHEVPR